MQRHKLTFTFLMLLFSTHLAFSQSEALKNVVNNLALFKQKKDLKFLGNAKKSIDSLLKVSPDSLDLEKNVYKAAVNSDILYSDSLNKLNQPSNLFNQTIALVENLSLKKKIYRFEDQLTFAKQCLANVYIRKAFVYFNNSDFINSLSLFQNAQFYAPAYKPLTAYIAYCNAKLGNLHIAAKYFTELITKETVKPEYVETAASIYKSLGDTAMALTLVRKGRELLPDDKSLLLDEANIYSDKKDYQRLFPLLPALLEIYNNNAEIAFVAANCYDHLNQFDKAETYYLKAVDINSSGYEPIFNLGLLFLKRSEVDKQAGSSQDVVQAAQWLEKANEILPNDIKCLKALQMVYTKTGNNDQINNVNNQLKQLTSQ